MTARRWYRGLAAAAVLLAACVGTPSSPGATVTAFVTPVLAEPAPATASAATSPTATAAPALPTLTPALPTLTPALPTVAPATAAASAAATASPSAAAVDPLTGLAVADPAVLNRRPLALKIPEFPRRVRPQW